MIQQEGLCEAREPRTGRLGNNHHPLSGKRNSTRWIPRFSGRHRDRDRGIYGWKTCQARNGRICCQEDKPNRHSRTLRRQRRSYSQRLAPTSSLLVRSFLPSKTAIFPSLGLGQHCASPTAMGGNHQPIYFGAGGPESNDNSHNTLSNNLYRPRSPDLSAFVSRPHQQTQVSGQSYYPPLSASRSASGQQPSVGRQGSKDVYSNLPNIPSPVTQRGSYDASPYFTPKGSVDSGYHAAQPGSTERRQTFGYNNAAGLTQSPISAVHRLNSGNGLSFSHQEQAPPQDQGLSQQAFSQAPLVFQPLSSANSPHMQLSPSEPPTGRRRRTRPGSNVNDDGGEHLPEHSTTPGPPSVKPGRKRKSGDDRREWTMGRAPGDPGPSFGIEIKTKFPVARIKRIMQADEDVGKVAQATPTAVCK